MAALNALSAAHRHLGGLDEVEVASTAVYIASAPSFSNQHLVADGASKVVGITSAPPAHLRGRNALPLDAVVEVQLVLLLRCTP